MPCTPRPTTTPHPSTLPALAATVRASGASPISSANPTDDMEAVDDIVTLGPLLKQLPERERRIVELRFFQDCTQSQIAQEIGISQMHVSRLLTRILGRLRNAMLDEPATGSEV